MFSIDLVCSYAISCLQKQNNSKKKGYDSNISVELEICVIRNYSLRVLLRTPF
jgi:hypothetical protein